MHFDVLTLFPEFFEAQKSHSIFKRGIESGKISLKTWNIRDFTENKHKCVDDVPYGGGPGMLMTPKPLYNAITHVKNQKTDNAPVVFLTPQGNLLNQDMVEDFADPKYSRIILLCGHYEGIDYRIREMLVDFEVSIGTFVLTGGELPAMVFMDAISRFVPGVLGKSASAEEESYSKALDGKKEYPQYTRPSEFMGKKVPDVLLSGHHAEIEKWRRNNLR